MQQHKGGVDAAVEHIRHCLFRHNRFANPNKSNNIDIREVGVGKYQYNDVVTPTTLLEICLCHKLILPKNVLLTIWQDMLVGEMPTQSFICIKQEFSRCQNSI